MLYHIQKNINLIMLGLRTPSLAAHSDRFRLDDNPNSLKRRIAFDYLNLRRMNLPINITIMYSLALLFIPFMPFKILVFMLLIFSNVEVIVLWVTGIAVTQIEANQFNEKFWNGYKYWFNVVQFTNITLIATFVLQVVHPDLLFMLGASWLLLMIYVSSLNYFSVSFSVITMGSQIVAFILVHIFILTQGRSIDVQLQDYSSLLIPAFMAFFTSFGLIQINHRLYFSNLAIERDFNIANLQLRESSILLENEKTFEDRVRNVLNEAIIVTNQHGDIIRSNTAFLKLFKLQDSTKNFGKLSKYIDDINLVQADGIQRSFQPNNDRHYIIHGVLLEDDELDSHQVYIIIDVTEKVRADESALQTQKLNALGNLTGGIAHDFNNFLAIILSNAELIQYADDVDEIKEKYTADIISAAHNATALTKRILNSVRKMPMRNEAIEIESVIDELLRMVRNSIEPYHKIRVSINTRRYVKSDRTLLENALLNLMLNARDAMLDGGEIQIRIYDDAQYIAFSIEDNGVGISEENLEKVTEPFFTMKKHEKGTGIGLSMVELFAKRSGGNFTISSKLSQGTQACICLPATDKKITKKALSKAPKKIAKISKKALNTSSLSVLIVDDNQALTKSLAIQIRNFGYQVDTAYSLADVRNLGSVSYDIVLCDVILNQESALDVWDYFREQNSIAKFIFISGNVPPAMMEKLEATGVTNILNKPLKAIELHEAIERVSKSQQKALIVER